MPKRAYSHIILDEIRKLRKAVEAKNDALAGDSLFLRSRLNDIHLKVASCYVKHDGNGKPYVKVNYSVAMDDITFDGNGEPIYPPALIAINELGLIDYSDMEKIAETIEESKKDS